MESIKQIMLHSKKRIYKPRQNKELETYLKRKLNKKNKDGTKDTRPKELKILHIAKATGLTYKQTRDRIDKLVTHGKLERFKAWKSYNNRVNYYRWL